MPKWNRRVNDALEFAAWFAVAVFLIGVINVVIVAARAIAWATS